MKSSVPSSFSAAFSIQVWITLHKIVRCFEGNRMPIDFLLKLWNCNAGQIGNAPKQELVNLFCEALRLHMICHDNFAILRQNFEYAAMAETGLLPVDESGAVVPKQAGN